MGETLRLPKGELLLTPEEIGQYFEINNNGCPDFVVDIGLPRISSTARAVLLGSENTGVDEIHFQPWKYIQRYAKTLEAVGQKPKITINEEGQGKIIVLKETPGGPNDKKEIFDPIKILLEKGVSPNQIKVMLGIREPFTQFESWLKFDQSRQTSIYKQGLDFLLDLINQYEQRGIKVVPFVFELFYPNAEDYWRWIINQLELEDKIHLPTGLKFSPSPRVTWHEADSRLDSLIPDNAVGSRYYRVVVEPVINKGNYEAPSPLIPMDDFSNFTFIPFLAPADLELLNEASKIYSQKAREFYNLALQNGLPNNEQFNSFLTQYYERIA